ncbi:MAG: hypothetical protein RSC06_10925 [Clostridia bacterium]
MPHEIGNQLKIICLIQARLEDAYLYALRKLREEKNAAIEERIAQCVKALDKPWLRMALHGDSEARKEETPSEFLRMICAVDALGAHQTITQRAFSVQCFGDSKRLKSKYRSKLLRILRRG